MSSLAYMAMRAGKTVGGSDRSESQAVKELQKAGCRVVIGHFEESVKDYDLVVYTAAVSEDSPELRGARGLGIPTMSRGAYLGDVMLAYPRRIGVSGTHGKTTTTTLLSHIAIETGADPTVMNGALSKTLDANAYRIGNGNCFLYEACEYKASFHDFHPTTAVITNIELDHTDFYPSLDSMIEAFRLSLKGAEIAVVNRDNEGAMQAVADFSGKTVTFSLSDRSADYTVRDLKSENGRSHFTLVVRGKEETEITLPLPGRFNVENALAAIAAACENGIPLDRACRSLRAFEAPDRRFEVLYRGAFLLADDYAHHPSEIAATLKSARELIGAGGRVITVFQSHTYTRTHDLFDGFVEALSLADLVLMPDIFAAREVNTLGVSSAALCKAIGDRATYLADFDEITKTLLQIARPGDVILTMGAGDVNKIGYKLKAILESDPI